VSRRFRPSRGRLKIHGHSCHARQAHSRTHVGINEGHTTQHSTEQRSKEAQHIAHRQRHVVWMARQSTDFRRFARPSPVASVSQRGDDGGASHQAAHPTPESHDKGGEGIPTAQQHRMHTHTHTHRERERDVEKRNKGEGQRGREVVSPHHTLSFLHMMPSATACNTLIAVSLFRCPGHRFV